MSFNTGDFYQLSEKRTAKDKEWVDFYSIEVPDYTDILRVVYPKNNYGLVGLINCTLNDGKVWFLKSSWLERNYSYVDPGLSADKKHPCSPLQDSLAQIIELVDKVNRLENELDFMRDSIKALENRF